MTYFKDLTKTEKKHLREMGVTTLKQMRNNAEYQAKYRREADHSEGFYEPCWECRAISRKLGLALTVKETK